MSLTFTYRFTHTPTGFSTNLEIDDANKVSMAINGHVPLRNRYRSILYSAPARELSEHESGRIYKEYDEFRWEDIAIGPPE